MKHYFLSRYSASKKILQGNYLCPRPHLEGSATFDKGLLPLPAGKGSLPDRKPGSSKKAFSHKELTLANKLCSGFKRLPIVGKAASFFNPLLPWFLVAGVCLLSSGCSTTSETFDCKGGKGVGCKSISEVNRMVDQGTLENGALGAGGNNVTIISPPELVIATSLSEGKDAGLQGDGLHQEGGLHQGGGLRQGGELRLADGGYVHRVSEEHMRVWIAPFQDDQGNLHEGSVVHTVLKPGYWRLQKGNE